MSHCFHIDEEET